ncbi:MAG: hypothetical protein JSS51_12625 [Planctomycetes bacterium]|nr:hypothetical protein [Planctomycetota bacterium]
MVDKELWTGGVLLGLGLAVPMLSIPAGFAFCGGLVAIGLSKAIGDPAPRPAVVALGAFAAAAVGLYVWARLIGAVVYKNKRVLRCSACSHSVAA